MPSADEKVIRRILAGEKRAFGELVDRHKDRAMTLAFSMLKNREDAEEALQDAFVRAFHALPRFEWKSRFSTWLYRIVYNVCATALSKRVEGVHLSIDEIAEPKLDVPSDDAPPDAEYESREFQEIVRDEVDKMPEMYAGILTLFLVNDMSYDEIAEVTGLPLGTVKVRLFRGRLLLRDAVTKRLRVNKASVA